MDQFWIYRHTGLNHNKEEEEDDDDKIMLRCCTQNCGRKDSERDD